VNRLRWREPSSAACWRSCSSISTRSSRPIDRSTSCGAKRLPTAPPRPSRPMSPKLGRVLEPDRRVRRVRRLMSTDGLPRRYWACSMRRSAREPSPRCPAPPTGCASPTSCSAMRSTTSSARAAVRSSTERSVTRALSGLPEGDSVLRTKLMARLSCAQSAISPSASAVCDSAAGGCHRHLSRSRHGVVAGTSRGRSTAHRGHPRARVVATTLRVGIRDAAPRGGPRQHPPLELGCHLP
jgi:hypothetical protein